MTIVAIGALRAKARMLLQCISSHPFLFGLVNAISAADFQLIQWCNFIIFTFSKQAFNKSLDFCKCS